MTSKLVPHVRNRYPDLPLQVDANSAYTLADLDTSKALDAFNLLLIEQPLAHDDIIDHARLQAELHTPICLDESIHTAEDARKALELGACRTINIKVSRVGGLLEAKKIHDLCQTSATSPSGAAACTSSASAAPPMSPSPASPASSSPATSPAPTSTTPKTSSTPPSSPSTARSPCPTAPGLGHEPIPDRIDRATIRKLDPSGMIKTRMIT